MGNTLPKWLKTTQGVVIYVEKTIKTTRELKLLM